MKKFHSCFPYTLLLTGSLSLLYYIYLSIIYGFSNISFSWTFCVIGVICMLWAMFELAHKKHILMMFPRMIQRTLITLFTIGLSFFCIIEGYIIYIGNQTIRTQSNTVLILGAQLNGKQISRSLRYRLIAALQFYEEHPNATFIVSGGQGDNEDISEAQAMRDYLVEKGMNPSQILLEDTSRNTQENMKYSYDLYDTLLDEHGVTIITNNFHMARATLIANQVGITKTHTYPAKTDYDLIPVFYFREFFGFCKDFIVSL